MNDSPVLKPLMLWGGTGQARVIANFAERIGFKLALVVDRRSVQPPVAGVDMVENEDGLRDWLARRPNTIIYGSVAIGGEHGRERRKLQRIMSSLDIRPATLIHPHTRIEDNAKIGEPSQILLGATICAGASIGANVIVNTNATVEHDCTVDDGAHVGPGALLLGEVSVRQDAFIGGGAVVLPRLLIGKGAIIGAGAVVTRDVEPFTVWAGNPARSIRTLKAY